MIGLLEKSHQASGGQCLQVQLLPLHVAFRAFSVGAVKHLCLSDGSDVFILRAFLNWQTFASLFLKRYIGQLKTLQKYIFLFLKDEIKRDINFCRNTQPG